MPYHRFFIVATLWIMLQPNLIAQFGIRISYDINQFNNWDSALKKSFKTKETLFPMSWGAGIDYWFRLKNRRIEFLPELAFTTSTTNYDNLSIEKFIIRSYSFHFHTQIYALDIGGDCDCPTFSKQGSSLQKGLFFQIAPGVSYYSAHGFPNSLLSSSPLTNGRSSGVTASIGAGLGIDLAWNDLVTITPMATYYFHSKMVWDNMVQTPTEGRDVQNYLRYAQFSVRVGLRLDYRNRYRR